VIELSSPPSSEREGDRTTVLLWVCEPFDQHFSFRVLLREVQAALRSRAPVNISLPPEVPAEDFVDGTVCWGTWTIPIYFERSLGFLEFWVYSDEALAALLPAIDGCCTWPEKTDAI
jgi:hypothetical protein